MNASDIVQACLFFGTLLLLTPPLGKFMFQVFEGQRHLLSFLAPVERWLYRLSGISAEAEMRWQQYAGAMLWFNLLGLVAVLALQTLQGWLPLNPQRLPGVPFWLAFNTAASFVTNTNWQAYSGENTMSYLTQMLGLTVQNFLSAASGMAVLLALVRGLTRRKTHLLGNFWVDVTRITLYVLLPLSLILAVLLVSQGVVQTLAPYVTATTVEGGHQVIPLGPAASQIAIKQLGTNGGGFFGVNSAHPFENPTPFTNFLEILGLMLIPAALTYSFGLLVGRRRHGWCLFAAMALLFLGGFLLAWSAETSTNPVTGLSLNLEGKEVRFGVMPSVYWATATTGTSCGAVNCMHDSLSPLAGMVASVNMMLGEIVFGGVGSGLYGMLLFVILTVFLAGLMVGRTPEYLGKKIEAREMIWTIVGILAPGVVMLLGTAVACLLPAARSSIANPGPHGFTEMLYAFASAAANNGSAFAGLNASTTFYNAGLAVAMLVGRFAVKIPVLIIAGSLAARKFTPPNSGTFPTDGLTFLAILIGVIVIVGALTFFPALLLGPVAEHVLMLRGTAF